MVGAIRELVARYADLPLGTVDATVVAAAERLGITAIATTDRRHFSVVRPAHAEAFELPLLSSERGPPARRPGHRRHA